MNLSNFTDFGLAVKTRLLHIGKTQTWLIKKISSKTGLFVDTSYIYKILTGQRKAPKVVAAICEILDIDIKGDRK